MRVHPWVETRVSGSTLATMTSARETPTVREVNLRELPPISRPGSGPPVALRVVGFVGLAVILVSILTTSPRPGLHGDGLLVTIGLVLLPGGVAGSCPTASGWSR